MRVLVGCFALVLCGTVTGDDKKDEVVDPAKLVGKWTTKGRENEILEFLKGGKLVMRRTVGDKEEAFDGTYKLDGNKLTVVAKPDGKEDKSTVTIKKLTDAEMVVVAESGNEVVMLRVKDK
ncbi:unnamed protein product [Gemmata massiliana]|uniref:Lipocalin-like domain-containing protein n=1 Tax=Gemmata massiliana TaxID=1210884 RepID=A0A6P2CSK1_9BACT|nr:TIGR03066 family protein [Gemmata massiliana]VTR91587.1 unnamed protein product [Gemmata massiliana]